jgi:hypothetical protein
MVIAVYDTEAEVKAVEQSGQYRKQLAKLAHLFNAPSSREVYAVVYYGVSK